MRVVLAVTFVSLAFTYFELDIVRAEEKSCKQVMADLTKRQLGGISACGKSLKFKNGKDKAKKMNCILKCVMTNEKVLNAEGYFDATQLDALIIKEFPPYLHEKANASFMPCSEKGATIDPNPETDEFCKSYDPFIKCLLGSLPTLCG
ncbi:uncharacterized protein LOC110844879 [Folsomia candida]|uniref:Uncharacterized protein n=1 Tax=Folsomia candida TaxID=158441 RepID=A0A226EQR1_FOLCA|nr:uncharacterized protein LOC110844879 [Folsomia candida]OXA59963.1 hypothetical protein Fcan01_04608 [Folsomia candida]